MGLSAILKALEVIPSDQPLLLLSDCKSALMNISKNLPDADIHFDDVREEKESLQEIEKRGFYSFLLKRIAKLLSRRRAHTIIHLVKGHNEIHGNEIADNAAKFGSKFIAIG